MSVRDEAGFWLCSKCTNLPAGFCETCAHNHALIGRLTGRADLVPHLKGLVESYRAEAFKASWERMVLLACHLRDRDTWRGGPARQAERFQAAYRQLSLGFER